MSDSQMDLTQVKGVESEGVDLHKFDKKEVTLENVEVLQVPSDFTPKDSEGNHQKQWVLKISSGVLETLGEGENTVEFRASELFNLVQDKDGNLTGFPKGERSNLGKFIRDLKINPIEIGNLQQLVDTLKGKTALVKSYDKEIQTTDGKTNTRTYLKFRY